MWQAMASVISVVISVLWDVTHPKVEEWLQQIPRTVSVQENGMLGRAKKRIYCSLQVILPGFFQLSFYFQLYSFF